MTITKYLPNTTACPGFSQHSSQKIWASTSNQSQELRRNRSGCWVGQTFLGLMGYSDDNFLLAPSREALQVMLKICENYATSHGLKFSTDPNPKKSKTRCLAFLQKEREVRPVVLCGDQLPWTTSCKHLGNTIVNTATAVAGDVRCQDIKTKRACFIDKNNDLIQEVNMIKSTSSIH